MNMLQSSIFLFSPSSIALVRFSCASDDMHVLVGTAKELVLNPRSLSGGFIYCYKLLNSGEKLEFVHKTVVDELPGAIATFQGRALIGTGRYLRIYDLGKKKLLRKCENKVLSFFLYI